VNGPVSAWHEVSIDRGDVGVRIDRVLQRHLASVPGATRARIQRLIAEGAVHLNGQPVPRTAWRVAADDLLTIRLPDRAPRTRPVAEPLPLDVRYEDNEVLIVDKPAGQVSHPAQGHRSGTLVNALVAHAAGRWSPALLTRLDKDTSGLVLVAKGGTVQAAMQGLAERNAIEKDYLAIVHGRPPARGTIDLALDRDPWDRRRVTVRDRGGVPSVTRFERVRSVRVSPREVLSVLRCRLITGRTHQIRVHLAARGWPILGDEAYGASPAHLASTVSMDRQALHAHRLAFTQPWSGARVEVVADLPADMQALLADR
jgi:23S rRNA pseudouridine1911/1915/1917 synthase